MDRFKNTIIRAARKAHEFIDDIKDLPSSDPIKIEAYTGYASKHGMYLKGRVLEDDNIMVTKSYQELKRIFHSFKRFETDELPGVRVNIYIDDQQYTEQTDEEGFFTLDITTPPSLDLTDKKFIRGYAELPDIIGEEGPVRADIKFKLSDPKAEYGVISDIDDTILQTHVTSLLHLKMMFVTFFKEAADRMAMEGMVELYREMAHTEAGAANPFFYVSNSPWNIYPMLVEFLRLQDLPAGPVLLRDFGLGMLHRDEGYRGHKIETISHIIKLNPALPFVMFGDSSSKDTDVYLELAREFPEQIKTIYIRHLKHTKNAHRIAKLIDSQGDTDAVLIDSTKEIIMHARTKGYVSDTFDLSVEAKIDEASNQ